MTAILAKTCRQFSVVLAVAVLLISGCGDDDSGSNNGAQGCDGGICADGGNGGDGGVGDASDAADATAVQTPSCETQGDQTCELSCGGSTCDGSAQACHVYASGVDTGQSDQNTYACEALPQECQPNPDCSCLEQHSEQFQGCESSPMGYTITHYGM